MDAAVPGRQSVTGVSDAEARNFQSGPSLELIMPAGGGRVPCVTEAVDDGAHGAGSGIGGIRDAGPWPRVDGRQLRAQHAPVLSASPDAHPDAPVTVQTRAGEAA